jgi:hypothetical protein
MIYKAGGFCYAQKQEGCGTMTVKAILFDLDERCWTRWTT